MHNVEWQDILGKVHTDDLDLVNNNKDSVFFYGNGTKPPISAPGSRMHAFAEGAECSKGCFIKVKVKIR